MHLSSKTGDIPAPGPQTSATRQTATIILDIDNDGLNDFVIGSQGAGPSVQWFKRTSQGWVRYLIESDTLPIEAGSTFYDIDADGDLDIVLAADSNITSALRNRVWWWENPYPNLDPDTRWTRREIKSGGDSQHHDQIFGDFDGDGKAELAFWNQGGSGPNTPDRLWVAEIPNDPHQTGEWSRTQIFVLDSGRAEGLDEADVDGDGKTDLIGGGRWFKHNSGTSYTANVIDDSLEFSRSAAGQLVPGGRPEIVLSSGDSVGPFRWYQWNGSSWIPHDLLTSDIDHGHSLAVGDVDGDGNLDIFSAEMRLDGGNSDAKVRVFLGDGSGGFTSQEVSSGIGSHEAKIGDLDGDGDLDILGKPFNWDLPRLDVWLQNGTAALGLDSWTRHVIDAARPYRSLFIDAGDLDGDGRRDIVTGGWWYRNPGSPSGQWTRNTIGSPMNNLAALSDFDNDGDLDVLGTQGIDTASNSQFAWARNNGAGQFSILTNIAAADGDFLQGVAIFQPQGGSRQAALSWHVAGKGVQSLTIPTNPSAQNWTWATLSSVSQDEALTAGDIDRDGDDDLLLGTRWLRNQGGSWQALTLNATSGNPDRNRLADINADGRLDAVVGFEAISVPGKLAWYEQPADPTSTWTEHVIANPTGPMSLDVGDLDQDGDLDIVVGEHNLANPSSARLLIFENTNGVGTAWNQHVVYTGDEHHDGAQLVDIDQDGDLDIISIGFDNPRVLLFENTAVAGSNPVDTTPPSAPSGLQASAVSSSRIELSWNAASDAESGIDKYRIFINGGFLIESSSISFSVTGLSADSNYSFQVSAVNGVGLEGPKSGSASATTFPNAPTPQVPTNSLALWLKADTGVQADGSAVSVWEDQSGNGRDAIQNTSSKRPRVVAAALGGRPAIDFDGTDDQLDFDLPVNGLQQMSIVLVTAADIDPSQSQPGVDRATIFWPETGSWGTVHVTAYPSTIWFRFGTGAVGNEPAIGRQSIGQGYSLTTVVKHFSNETLFVNGVVARGFSGQQTSIANTSSSARIGRGQGDTYFDGRVAEILVYTRALSTAELIDLGDYINAKYFNNSLPINHGPTPDAGADRVAVVGEALPIEGTASDDGLPNGTLTTTWSQVGGPATASFANPDAPATSVQFPQPGNYVLRLTANDGLLGVSDDVSVTVVASSSLSKVFYFPIVGDGVSFGIQLLTSVTLANTGSTAPLLVEVFDTDGHPQSFQWKAPFGPSAAVGKMLGSGEALQIESESGQDLKFGYIRVRSGEGIAGSAVLTRRENGAVVYEAGVPSASPSSRFSIFVDSLGARDTGLALVRPGNAGEGSPGNVHLTLRNTSGGLVAQTDLELAPGGHNSQFVYEMFPEPTRTPATEMRGTLEVSSDFPVAAVTTRQNEPPNNGSATLTTFPVVDPEANETGQFVFAQVGDGTDGGLEFHTSLIFVNAGQSGSVRVRLYDSDGAPLALNWEGFGTVSEFQLNLTAGQAFVTQTNAAGPIHTGFALVDADPGIGGIAVFTRVDAAEQRVLYEAGVLGVYPLEDFTILFDAMDQRGTGIAFANPTDDPVEMTVRLHDDGFKQQETKSILLPPRGHLAQFVNEIFAGNTLEFGVVTVQAFGSVAAVALRQNPAPTLTPIPVIRGRADQ